MKERWVRKENYTPKEGGTSKSHDLKLKRILEHFAAVEPSLLKEWVEAANELERVHSLYCDI
jgi:hypothetical protein